MKRTIALVAGVGLLLIASKVIAEDVLHLPLEDLARGWLTDAGTAGAAAIIALLLVDIALPIPSSLVMVLSGAAFGVAWGAAIALAGSIGGEWLGFELVRRYGRRASARLVGDDEIARLDGMFRRHGILLVVVTRALPVVMETVSVVAGLSAMRRRDFLIASVVGTAPIVVIYAYAGAVSRQVGNVLPAAVILAAVAAFGWVVYRARFKDT